MDRFFYNHEDKITIFLVVSVFVSVVLLMNIERIKECQIEAEGLNMEYEYSFFAGCRIKHDGKLIPLNNYRFNEEIK